MSFINITTNNQSRQLRSVSTVIDNWVYIPGNTVTGDYTKPYAITSLDEFKSQFGDFEVEGSRTFDYVTGVLSAGLPVIFQRIVGQYNQEPDPSQTRCAGVAHITKQTTTEGEGDNVHTVTKDVPQLTIYAKYPGTFGNKLTITTEETETSLWVTVYYGYTQLETKRLAVFEKDESRTSKNAKIMANIKNIDYEFDYIKIDLDANITAETFDFPKYDKKELNATFVGTDYPDNLVATQIPEYIKNMTDRLLWQPKFITSGGYTDGKTDATKSIAEAMKKLTKERQDCRALIDAPIHCSAAEYKSFAQAVQYTQTSDTELIPSASMYAPWLYMTIGSDTGWMPGSYAFLVTAGAAVSGGTPIYTPKAGLISGVVNGIIRPEIEIGSSVVEDWQKNSEVNINPIMRLQGGDYIIGGNSTLLLPDAYSGENNAMLESSADLTVIEIRRFVYNIAQELQYQYNSAESFETFSVRTSQFLNTMISNGAVTDYEIIDTSSDANPRTLSITLNVLLSPTIKYINILLNVNYGSIELTTNTNGGAE